jgi:hypothetical protein
MTEGVLIGEAKKCSGSMADNYVPLEASDLIWPGIAGQD